MPVPGWVETRGVHRVVGGEMVSCLPSMSTRGGFSSLCLARAGMGPGRAAAATCLLVVNRWAGPCARGRRKKKVQAIERERERESEQVG